MILRDNLSQCLSGGWKQPPFVVSKGGLPIKRCMKKGAIARSEPGFMCHALVSKSAVQEAETDELINKIYDGSADKLFAALLGRKKLSEEQIEKLKQIVGDLE